jgi:hypothetical protein
MHKMMATALAGLAFVLLTFADGQSGPALALTKAQCQINYSVCSKSCSTPICLRDCTKRRAVCLSNAN